ncbi:MAG TPA: alpha/beta hydrolase, partial [Thermoleophilaceae bacterium]
MTDGVRRGEIRALGLRTPVLETGPEDASEAVVFLHGHPGCGADWGDLLARVGASARCIAFDLPGFGDADKPRDWDYSPGGGATWLAAALHELGVERAHLVVHDYGGPIGLIWGLAHPDAWASVVMIDIGVLIGYRWHPIAQLYRVPVLGELMCRTTFEAAFRLLIDRYNPQPRKLPREFVDRMWAGYDLGTRRAVMSFYRASPPGGMERMVDAYRVLDKPALVVWGRHDPATRVEHAESQRRSFPSARVVVLEDSGHWAHIDDPEGAANAIVPFLREQLGVATRSV